MLFGSDEKQLDLRKLILEIEQLRLLNIYHRHLRIAEDSNFAICAYHPLHHFTRQFYIWIIPRRLILHINRTDVILNFRFLNAHCNQVIRNKTSRIDFGNQVFDFYFARHLSILNLPFTAEYIIAHLCRFVNRFFTN